MDENRSETNFFHGQIDEVIAQKILEQSGKGNPYYSETLPSNQEFAPFYDSNSDRIYDPSISDYPIIENDYLDAIPDEILYSIINDEGPV